MPWNHETKKSQVCQKTCLPRDTLNGQIKATLELLQNFQTKALIRPLDWSKKEFQHHCLILFSFVLHFSAHHSWTRASRFVEQSKFAQFWSGFEVAAPFVCSIVHPYHSYLTNLTNNKGTPPEKRMFSFGHCPNYLSPPSPSIGQLVLIFRPSKRNI